MRDLESPTISRGRLIELLNEDLAHEVRAVKRYATASQHRNNLDNTNIIEQLKPSVDIDFSHALTLAAQIDTLGGLPHINQQASSCAEGEYEVLRAHIDTQTASIENYTIRIRQSEELAEQLLAASLREIIDQKREQRSRLLDIINDVDGEDLEITDYDIVSFKM